MKTYVLVCFLCAICLPICSHGRKDSFVSDGGVVNEKCLADNCASPYDTCLLYTKCSLLLSCLDKCIEGFENDTTPLKSVTLNCYITCTFSYADIFYVALSRCLVDNKCLTLPSMPLTCKYPNNVTVRTKYQVSDLKKGWWKVRGLHPTFDCLPCQHIFFDPVPYDENNFVYRPTFEFFTVNNTYQLVNGSILAPLGNTNPGDPIGISYYLFGIPMQMSWYALDGTFDDQFVLVYYCGNMLQWNFEGAMMLSRTQNLPPDADDTFKNLISRSTGIEYSQFCTPEFQSCPN